MTPYQVQEGYTGKINTEVFISSLEHYTINRNKLTRLILDEGDWVASCSSWFIPGESALWYPLDRRMGGHLISFGCSSAEEKNQMSNSGCPANILLLY
jgi:hypothetical protein